MNRRILSIIVIVLLVVSGVIYEIMARTSSDAESVSNTNLSAESKSGFIIPAEFSMSVYSTGLKGPRVLVSDPGGAVIASLTSEGKIIALQDKNHDGKADEVKTILSGLKAPHGLAFKCGDKQCSLYVAEENQLSSYDYDPANFAAKNKKILLPLPTSGRHTTKSLLLFQNKLLISVGSSCDACREKDNRRAAVLSYDLITRKSGVFATGLRNSVFMTLQSSTGKIFATEMGRDYLGDNIPPDEINILKQGNDYGWPDCYGKNIPDKNFSKNANVCSSKTPSFIDIPAHSAPLGLAFAPAGWGQQYQNDLLVAYHGSWNRSTPAGYKIVLMQIDAQGKYLGAKDFVTGFLKNGQKIGRPTGILSTDKGVYFADDLSGKIYFVRKN